ncbi:sigma factor-like helix-turn-helix DNA-binding protein [Nocardioides jiangxiensis]|uniref:Sigma factor-like helix-turn-helix DNA-binding protein n=1 Tax=Nocardioides jiangxiensis TaxID=3064524 RepID=A0ABT9B430_9ACTN|nr:sigma factor-like helix-turn-helix DNA-binding protein [Nocardioides sp. WY-20]MDO7869482.1 sigma factor-like helix-turn-helix DNA-binding protein [Nocardioides sp. WY-20]
MAVIELRTPPPRPQDADAAVDALYRTHWRPLVRLSVLLVGDLGSAERLVEDSFVAMHRHWHRLRDTERAQAYLRTTVVRRCRRSGHGPGRAGIRRVDENGGERKLTDRAVPADAPGSRRDLVLRALQALPETQREVVALRYYLHLSDAEVADTLGIRRRAVDLHLSRGTAALSTAVAEAEALHPAPGPQVR